MFAEAKRLCQRRSSTHILMPDAPYPCFLASLVGKHFGLMIAASIVLSQVRDNFALVLLLVSIFGKDLPPTRDWKVPLV